MPAFIRNSTPNLLNEALRVVTIGLIATLPRQIDGYTLTRIWFDESSVEASMRTELCNSCSAIGCLNCDCTSYQRKPRPDIVAEYVDKRD